MAQKKIEFSIDGGQHWIVPKQPITFTPQWETTFSDDTDRTVGGSFYGSALFTVESYAVEFVELTPSEASQILQVIIPVPGRLTYKIKYMSWYEGHWTTADFYTGKGSLSVKTLEVGKEKLESISFNAVKTEKIA